MPDINAVTEDDVEYVNKSIKDENLSYDSVRLASKSAADLFQWVSNIINYRTITNEVKRIVGSEWNSEWDKLVSIKQTIIEPIREEEKVFW